MNGESVNDSNKVGSYLRNTTSSSNTSSTSYSSSPRLRRFDDMKKSYLSGASAANSASASSIPSYTSTFSSKYGGGAASATAGGTYRLASLDRLAMRQKLYETNGTDGQAPAPGSHGQAPAPGSHPAASSVVSAAPSAKENHAPSPPTAHTNLQSKREMFFKSEGTVSGGGSGGGGGGGGGGPIAPPSTAPPAPPVTAPNTAPPPPPNTNSTPNCNAAPTSVASIKEQLLTTKERKEHKDEENKENKLVKEMVKERRPREVDGYVGFVNLPNQVYRKAVKRGFEFTLMVVGESGLGKSTMINSMFLSEVYSADYPGPSHRVKKTVQVDTTKVLLKENGVNLMLTVVDTPGFGDAVDNSDCWQPIIDFIETKYEDYLNAESRVNRKVIADSRVHCCLYFITPSGHGLKPLDIEFMRRLHDKVNIIPVIAKADTLTPDECQHLKKQVLNEIAQHKIKIYEFPEDDRDSSNAKFKQRVPFAVVGSNTTIEVEGKKVRGRRYPWGVVEVENLEHCDFIPLRDMMIRTHMQDLKDVTNNVHYENFRCRKLAGGTTDGKGKMANNSCPQRIMNSFVTVWNPLAQMEEEKKEHSNRMMKMESEMEQVFEMKVSEKMNKLKELEADLEKRNESMRKKLADEMAELEEEKLRFEQEKKAWENANGVTLEDLRRRSLESVSKETSSLASSGSTSGGSSQKGSPKFSRTYSLPRHKFKQNEQCQQQ
ncbi:septin 7-like protein pnut isoform X3 [Oratosquilla oratoria]|uniref:septin 7-like protein pnut isoform X3 n=1 Tax=Oratosquilla oratoria TaxID=337810 RepID=UPI003F777E3A